MENELVQDIFLPFQLVKKHGDPLVNQPYTYFKFIIFYVRVGSY